MGFCCIGRRRRRAKEDEAAEAATRAWCREAVNPKVPQTPAASRALETRTPLHARAVVRPRRWKSSSARRRADRHPSRRPRGAATWTRPGAPAARPPLPPPQASSGDGRVVARRAWATSAGWPPRERRETDKASPKSAGAPHRRLDAAADAAAAHAHAAGRRERDVRRIWEAAALRGLSTPALVADLERTLGTRLRPRHATVQKARRGNGGGYEGWLRRHFASPPRRRSRTSPPAATPRPKVWI